MLPFGACSGSTKLTSSNAPVSKRSVWLCSKLCGGEDLYRVVLVKADLRLVLDLPLQLYKYINTAEGGHFIAYVHRVVIATTPEHPAFA